MACKNGYGATGAPMALGPIVAGASQSRTGLLTRAALLSFAAHSLFFRFALGRQFIDAASFSTVRVVAGAVTLSIILLVQRRGGGAKLAFDWRSVAALCAYMLCFSFAYLSLQAGTGALILFGCVQLTMFIVS